MERSNESTQTFEIENGKVEELLITIPSEFQNLNCLSLAYYIYIGK